MDLGLHLFGPTMITSVGCIMGSIISLVPFPGTVFGFADRPDQPGRLRLQIVHLTPGTKEMVIVEPKR